MEIFLYVLALLVAIFISNLVNRFVPFVSVPLIQIGLGVMIALVPITFDLKLNPELFLVMFIAPLLFNDGRRTDKKALWGMRMPILVLALGLVFATVVVIGYFVNWMIPTIPLAAAFALAAALAPTDAVAVSSLSGRINLPKRIMNLLEGEALINDASGLVAFQFAIAAMVTGVFSLLDASISFFVIAIGGVLVGLVLSWLKFRFLKWVRGLGMEDVTFHMLIQILTPFIIYLVAEEFHVSGILAVVAAGIMHSMERKKIDPQSVKLNIVSQSTWSVIIFVLNGLVFLLLGTQLPSIIEVVWNDSGISNWQVTAYILSITAALILLRFVWVYMSWNIGAKKRDKHNKKTTRPKLRPVILTSLSGVRGAVTLASALAIPFFLDDGTLFPQRALIIFLASGVILCTLVIATFILPLLAKNEEVTTEDERAEKATRIRILRNVIRELKEQTLPETKAATDEVIEDYRRRIYDLQHNSSNKKMDEREREKRLEIIEWQRMNTQKKADSGELVATDSYRYQHYLNMVEQAIKQRFRTKIKTAWMFFVRLMMFVIHPKKWYKISHKMKKGISKDNERFQAIRKLREENEILVIQKLKEQLTKENADIIGPLITEHTMFLERIRNDSNITRRKRAKSEQKKREVQIVAFQTERDIIQHLFETGGISRDLARELRQNLNMIETYLYDDFLGTD
ncbi:Na+/H+ antiporter [Listeria sp. FSL L7-1509]|uniref:Na+/H+ antiporter n=1 Tax=Listeria immobilis TaxID=2713502 RepID=A0ABR6SS57_9LIST|nr:Na+/H+ antiporter [Listeria immobilis]MBC1483304.1 Na+/H+ antiporter [Listeria immobilis]MBC1505697.1 Na+/H+ antiporter [Listeria immobilis]MBC1508512.1 Na+/H+ antiporter [Listeria immobilis]MBC6302031.1 Na+/H+ antiporter [Listeria immobilis]MBC6311056.1 Na+/H+ antiporter [Listeria immobilis]